MTFNAGTSGQCITVTFTVLNTENNWDFLYIYDGPNTGSPLLGTYTGVPAVPFTITSSSGSLTFRFTSDGSVTAPGWTATIACTTCQYIMNNNTVTLPCGSTYNFYDSGGPGGNYANNQNLTMTFNAGSPGQCITVTFTTFDIENNYDFLYIYNGPNTGSPLIGTYTGTPAVPFTITSSSGSLTFRFTSDNIINRPGWAATITCTGSCATPPPAPIQDCIGAMTICSDATVPGNASGQGVEEINSSNNGCLSAGVGENQSSWYVFSPTASGNIALSIDVNTATDYDFAIWGPYPNGSTTATICPPNQQPIRCSFAAGSTTFSATGSYNTGIGHPIHSSPQFALPTPAIYDGSGNTLNGWVPGLQVTAGQVYILLVDNWTANSNPFTLNFTLSGGASLDCTVLPIELLNFNVTNLGHENLLDWNTASEMNSDYIVIERLSNDEKEFYEIGKMKAMGNSHIQVGYAFIDKKPNYGYNYYRLKMVDFDGSFEYSDIVAVKNLFDADFAIKNIYPNPTTEDFYIDVNSNIDENLIITLTDVYGKKLNQFEYNVVNGKNTIKVNTEKIERGLIFVNITSANNSNINITQKIVKQ
jgi:hypothetical protein